MKRKEQLEKTFSGLVKMRCSRKLTRFAWRKVLSELATMPSSGSRSCYATKDNLGQVEQEKEQGCRTQCVWKGDEIRIYRISCDEVGVKTARIACSNACCRGSRTCYASRDNSDDTNKRKSKDLEPNASRRVDLFPECLITCDARESRRQARSVEPRRQAEVQQEEKERS